ncbi:MAG TPA: hypothetical protein VFF63_08440 [Candidatus Babeliales bacterium]|nr:hypothetical protein [Candidatus Babeliales bacterium]
MRPETAAMRLFASIVLALASIAPATALAQSASPSPSPSANPTPSPNPAQAAAIALAQSRIDTMLRTGHADPSWFSKGFLEQIPANQVDYAIVAMTRQLGAYKSLELTPDKFVAHFVNGTAGVFIHFDAKNKIDGLVFQPTPTI